MIREPKRRIVEERVDKKPEVDSERDSPDIYNEDKKVNIATEETENICNQKSETHATGLFRILHNPESFDEDLTENVVKPELLKIEPDLDFIDDVADQTETDRSSKSGNKGGMNEITFSDQDTLPQDGVCDLEDEDSANKTESDLPPLAKAGDSEYDTDTHLTTDSDWTINMHETNIDIIQMEWDLKTVEVKFETILIEINDLENEIEIDNEHIQGMEIQLEKIKETYDKNQVVKDEFEKKMLKEDKKNSPTNFEGHKTEFDIKGDIERLLYKENEIKYNDKRKKERDITSNSSKNTDDETFFSMTPTPEASEEETFNEQVKTKDATTETTEEEENHTELLITCLVR